MIGASLPRRLGANGARLVRRGVDRLWLARRAPFWVLLRLAPPLDETRVAAPIAFGRERTPSLLEALRVLDAAAGDPHVGGVLLRLAGAPGGFAAAAALRRAVDRVRAAGKPVVAWGDRIGQPAYWLASGADRLWLPETGSIELVGLRAEGLYLAGLLERLDVRADVVRIGSHKTAAEMFTRAGMSPEQREQIGAWLDDVFDALVEAVASGRRLDPAAVRAHVDAGPWGARAACEAGLADACRYPDEVEAELLALVPGSGDPRPGGRPPRPRLVDALAYDGLRAADPGWRPLLHDLPHVAYVAATGPIHRRGGFSGVSAVGLGRLLRRLGDDAAVRAVVLRLSSPGGDPLASDLLWRSLRVVARDKPVVVSMGDVAASGGYFVAVGADAVLAEATTLTGSIGVVGGKLDLGGLYERLGIGSDAVMRGARAGLHSPARGFTPDERQAVRREMREIYDVFLRRVEAGRGLARAAVERVAGGRIWSGRRARELGLVDALGGPLEALAEARARAGIAPDERVVVDVLPRARPLDAVRGLLGVGASLDG